MWSCVWRPNRQASAIKIEKSVRGTVRCGKVYFNTAVLVSGCGRKNCKPTLLPNSNFCSCLSITVVPARSWRFPESENSTRPSDCNQYPPSSRLIFAWRRLRFAWKASCTPAVGTACPIHTSSCGHTNTVAIESIQSTNRQFRSIIFNKQKA